MRIIKFPFEVKYNHKYYPANTQIEILDKDLQNALKNRGSEVETSQVSKRTRKRDTNDSTRKAQNLDS